jgi:hypothetical protein
MRTVRSPQWIPFSRLGVACALAALLLTGCGGPRLTVVDSGKIYTARQAEDLARATEVGATGSISADSAAAARQRTLIELRRQGGEGPRVADLLTRGFPARTQAVPVLVQKAKVDGRDAILVVEATPGAGGRLTSRRLWVFDATTGTVLDSASFR